MIDNRIRKGLTFAVIILFIGITIQPAFANVVSITKELNENDNNSGDFDLGFILFTVYYIYFVGRYTRMAWFVKFELTDYDTGELIEEKTSLLGVYLFKFIPKGHNYMVKVTTPNGWESSIIKNMDFFCWSHIGVLIIY